MTVTFTLEERLYGTLAAYRELAQREPSREVSLIITKIEEAVLWNDALRDRKGLGLLGLNARA